MAEKIKNFFKKKKADAKFKLAGPGHKLTESSSNSASSSKKKDGYKVVPRGELSAEARQAAEAAMARLGNKKKDSAFNTSFAAIQAQVKKELEDERKQKTLTEKQLEPSKPTVKEFELPPNLAVEGVYFRCPLVSSHEVLSKNEWSDKIKDFLYEQLEQEPGLTACLIIQSLNKNREKVQACIETLCKYIDNVINNPTEEKYRRIRMQNRVFSEKVEPIEGAIQFLNAVGFDKIEENGEGFLVLTFKDDGDEELTKIQMLRDALISAEPIPLELDRNIQVLSPAQASTKVELPPVFFNLSPEELKKEQESRTEQVEKNMQLRTKAMREREEMREIRKYRFALVRIRFPDAIFLQGTFGVYESLSAIFDFVRENLAFEGIPFQLSDATGAKLNEEEDRDKTLIDLRLVPASVLIFSWHPDVLEELSKHEDMTFLKPELLMLMRTI